MKRILIVPLALLFAAGSALASPLCGSASLSSYISAYGTNDVTNACQIGDKLFYDFSYSGSTLAPDSSGITVDLFAGATPADPGLSFGSFGFAVYGGQTLDATITYSVATVSGSSLLEDYSLDIAGAYFDGSAITGIGSVTESFSNPAVGPLVDAIVPGGVNSVSGAVIFNPHVSGTTVTTAIHMTLPETDETGFITISGVNEGFSEQLPEPGVVVLIGSGLCFLGLRRKARKTRA